MDLTTETLHKLSNPVLTQYLQMLNATESPPIFHAWSLLSAASACMTRRCWFNLGAVAIYPNQYIMLVGPAGVRKSSAIRFSKKILQDIPIRWSPNSTAGRLQGLISVMGGENNRMSEEDKAFKEAMDAAGGMDIGGAVEMDLADPFADLHALQRHAMYIAEGEIVSFLGMKMDEFITFLGDMWDKSGEESFTYSLKRESVTLSKPCLNMIGGITPMHITTYLPAQSIGQGFTSRVVMVYADKAKKIPWPEEIPDEEYMVFRKIMRHIFDTFDGPMSYTPEAKAAIIELYAHKIEIDDARFIHYAERRQAHMLKAAMALAALRLDMTITEADIRDAHALLVLTEKRMAESLGEYGMDKGSLAKARITSILRNAVEPLSVHRIVMNVGSDVPRTEINKALYQLTQDGVIIELRLCDPAGLQRNGYVWPSETNPFKKNDEVAVNYYMGEGQQPQGEKATKRKSAVERAVQSLAPKQQAPDTDALVGDVLRETVEATTLAAQGFASVTEKLAALVRINRGNETPLN